MHMIKSKSFQKNIFFSVGAIFVLFALSFSIYQYKREKEYKIDILHARLQMYNYEMMHTLGQQELLDKESFMSYVAKHHYEGLRVSVIDSTGRVLMDSREPNVNLLDNHLRRREIDVALHQGNGYDIKRVSASTHRMYFYSATSFGRIVIRSAVPYSAELTKSLQADNTYLVFALLLTILLGVILYFHTSRIGRHISCLREFAQKAEQGEELDHELEQSLPDDELGDISHTIIMLYWKLHHAEEEKLRIKKQLTQNAAHELKTPAASIRGFLESIIENPDMKQDTRQHFLERCYAQSQRMCRLLQDMASLTKLDETQECIERGIELSEMNQQVDVAKMVDNVLEDTALQLKEKGIAVVKNMPREMNIKGNPTLIYGIFRNLIDNAIAYATGATRLCIIGMEVEDGDRRAYEFTISDNGQGVSPEHLPHLFERFYRVEKGRSRKMGGTGLGLAIVKNSVTAHGGTVSAEIAPHGGLSIRFSLACQ